MQILAEIFDHIPTACFHVNQTGILTHINRQAIELFKKNNEDCIGRHIWDVFPQAKTTTYFNAIHLALDEKQPAKQEILCPLTDRWLELTATPVSTGVILSFCDVHSIKQAEKTKDQFRLFVTASSNMVYRMSADWNQMYFLDGKNVLADLNHSTVNWTDIYLPREAEKQVWDAVRLAIESKNIFELEHQVIQSDGTIGWMYSRAIPVLDAEGEILEWLGAGNDITSRKRTETALRESEHRFELSSDKYKSLFNSIDQGFCVIKMLFSKEGKPEDYIFLEMNKAFEAQTGLSDVVGKNIRSLAPEHEEYWYTIYGAVATNGNPRRFEAEAAALGRWYDVYAFAIEDPGQHHVAVLFNDITERKHREANLAFLNDISHHLERLTSINQTLDTIAEKIGHYLQLGRCVFCEVVEKEDIAVMTHDWHVPELSSAVGQVSISKLVNEEFRKQCLAGETIAIDHVLESSLVAGQHIKDLFDISALICVPLLVGRQLRFVLMVHHIEPRVWHKDETELLRELTTRIWMRLERARAEELQKNYSARLEQEVSDRTWQLNQNYALLQTIYNTTLIGMSVFAPVYNDKKNITDFKIIIVNKNFEQAFGHTDMAEKLYTKLFPAIRQIGLFDLMVSTFESDQPGKMEYHHNFSGTDRWYSTMFVKGEGILVSTNLDITERVESEKNLRRMKVRQQQEIFEVTLNTQEEERRRISESLHNGLGQLLYGIKLSLGYLSLTLAEKQPAKYTQSKDYTDKLLKEAINETRRISYELMPTVLAEFGLEAAIKEVCSQLQEGVRFNCAVNTGTTKLDSYLELAVFRTVQELMVNVVKHAQTSRATVRVTADEDLVKIIVEDNGKGITPGVQEKPGIGLVSIRNKAELLNGSLDIKSSPGKGTKIEVQFRVVHSER